MDPITQRIYNRLHKKNNSFQAVIVGMTGTGKSFTGLTFGHELDTKFKIRNNVILNPRRFLRFINSDPDPGTPFLGDEIGKWFSARDWYTFQNKMMSIVLETNRFMRLAAFWTVPNFRMIDVTLRDLCHATIETLGINEDIQRCIAKYKYRRLNPMTGKGYDIFPRVRNNRGELITIDRIRIARPPSELEYKYLDQKEKNLKGYYSDMLSFIERAEKFSRRTAKKKKDLITKDLEKGMKVADIARKRRTAAAYVRQIRQEMIEKPL